EQRGAFLRRELEGDRPPRRLARGTELAALGEVVDLDDDAVDLVVEIVTVLEPVLAEPEDIVEAADLPDLGVHREPGRPQPVERLRVATERGAALDNTDLVAEKRELAGGSDLRVLLP